VENDGSVTRSLQGAEVKTFQDLIGWVEERTVGADEGKRRGHHIQTWKKFYRRLRKVVYESGGLLRLEDTKGNPLDVAKTDTSDPIVIDLSYFAGKPELQRFVVATILRQLIEARTGTNVQKGLRYLVTLDELNRFAPRGATDPITRLVELVASEMRSQGIILLGAQQQASKVSEKIIENAGIQALGKSGAVELDAKVWKGLSASARRKAESLPPNEKLVMQDNFREPMHVRVPFPVWAMNPAEAEPVTNGDDSENSDADDLRDLIDR
jgi:DNA helicase HerA-like ATPase